LNAAHNDDSLNLLGESINTLKKYMVKDVSKEVCLEVNSKRAKYTLMSHRQSAGKNHKNHRSCKELMKFKYLGKTA
jgi:hypothetical protein